MQNVVVKDGIKLTGPSHAPPTREELSMDLKGEYRLPARREAVWAALNDTNVLRDCIPGCQSLEMTGENEMAATVVTKIGPV